MAGLILTGGAGADTLNGGAGDDQLDGGAGSDVLNGGNGNDRYLITALTGGDDTVTDTGGTNDALVWISGTSSNTSIDVSRGGSSTTNANLVVKVYQDGVLKQTNTVVGQFSNTASTATTISGTAPTSAIERLYISDDDQYLKIVDGFLKIVDGLTGTASDELIVGTAAANTLTGKAGTDFMYGGSGNDTLNGGNGNDLLDGGAGNDTLNGDEGDDLLDGVAGSDALNGGNGNDRYLITALTGGDDTVTDTGGTADVLVWNGGTSPNTSIDVSRGGSSTTNANLVVKVYQDGVLKQTNTVVGQFSNTASTATTISGTAPTSAIEGVYIADDDQYLKIVDGLTGTASDELIVGTAGANTLTGYAGIDFMYGGAGNDTLNGGEGDDQLDGGAGSDVLNGGNGNDRYFITALTGGDDTVTDTGGTADALVWNSGTSSNTYIDVSRGGSSTTNANLVVKVYQDGVLKQTNTVVGQFSNTASTATTISGTAPTSAIEGVYIADDDQYLKIVDGLTGKASDELIVGTAGANTLTGNAGIDFMYGGAGNDTLNGGEGDDQLDGGAGSDALNGGNGNDRYFITALTGGDDTVTDTGGTNDALVWNSGTSSNTYIDVSRGGSSTTNANLVVKVYQDGVLKQTNTVVGQFSNTASTATTISGTAPTSAIEGVYIADDDQYLKIVDGLTGTASDELIVGTAGANTLTGNAGTDFMYGGAGNDTLYGGAGSDVIFAGDGDDWLSGYEEYSDSQLSNTEFIAKLNLEKDNSIDRLHGGKGNDFYLFDNFLNTPEIIENAGEGTDTVLGDLASYTLEKNVENYVNDRGSSTSATVITGNASDNLIKTTPSGWDSIDEILNSVGSHAKKEAFYGLAGNDTLNSGSGDDILDGGVGVDVMWGGAGNDVYYVDNASDQTNEAVSASNLTDAGGSDLVYSSVTRTLGNYLENLTLTGTVAINGTGNTLANTIIGNGAANTLNGGFGNDTLDGGAGSVADTIDGGTGIDTVSYASLASTLLTGVTLNLGGVKDSNGYLSASGLGGADKVKGVENILGSSYADVFTGDSAANTLNGGAGNDSLSGGVGNDTLIGGLGNDTLSGGIGNDVFVFNSATANNLDTILDFTTGTDKIQLSKSIFANLGATGNLTENAFWSAAGAVKGNDANDRIVYNTTTGALYYDADGSGSGAAVQIALLGTSSHPATLFSDFAVIA